MHWVQFKAKRTAFIKQDSRALSALSISTERVCFHKNTWWGQWEWTENIMSITTISAGAPHISLQHFSKSVLNHLNQKDLTISLGESSIVIWLLPQRQFSWYSPGILHILHFLHIPKYKSWFWLGFLLVISYRNIFLSVFSHFSYSHCIILKDTTNIHLPILTRNPL